MHLFCVWENMPLNNVNESMVYQFVVFNVRSVPYLSLPVRKQNHMWHLGIPFSF